MAEVSKSGGARLTLAWVALASALFLPVWFVGAGLGSKWGLWSWQFGLGKMFMEWGPLLLGAVLVICIVSLIAALIKAPRVKPLVLTGVALFIFAMVAGRLAVMANAAQNLPPIHDVQTDWSDPVRFSDAIMSERNTVEGVNPVKDDPVISEQAKSRWPDMVGRRVADVQEEKYEKISTLITVVEPEKVFVATTLTLSELGIEIVHEQKGPDVYLVEGTYTSRLFGFKDDVAVRIRPKGKGSEVDIRSISRVGLSDVGVNFERVYAILDRLKLRLKELDPDLAKADDADD